MKRVAIHEHAIRLQSGVAHRTRHRLAKRGGNAYLVDARRRNMAQADAASAMTAGTSDGGAAVMGGASSKLLARKETLLFVMVAVIILFGCYGRGYDASAFIYATF